MFIIIVSEFIASENLAKIEDKKDYDEEEEEYLGNDSIGYDTTEETQNRDKFSPYKGYSEQQYNDEGDDYYEDLSVQLKNAKFSQPKNPYQDHEEGDEESTEEYLEDVIESPEEEGEQIYSSKPANPRKNVEQLNTNYRANNRVKRQASSTTEDIVNAFSDSSKEETFGEDTAECDDEDENIDYENKRCKKGETFCLETGRCTSSTCARNQIR